MELLRVAQEIDHLLQLELRLLHAGHIVKGRLGRAGFLQAGTAAAETENALRRLAASSHEPDPDRDQHEEGQEGEQQASEAARVLLDHGRDVVALQQGEERRIGEPHVVGHGRAELGVRDPVVGKRRLQIALGVLALDRDVRHVAAVDLGQELRVAEVDPGRPAEPAQNRREQDEDVEAQAGQQGEPKPGPRLSRGFGALGRRRRLVGAERHIGLVYASRPIRKHFN